jgi:hypothetical protein
MGNTAAMATEPPLSLAQHQAMRALLCDRLAAEVVTGFANEGIESILLKGRSFAALLYPAGGRTYNDVDLLVRHRDIPAATTWLELHGFQDATAGFAPAERIEDATLFTRPRDDGYFDSLDLHWSLHCLTVEPDLTWRVLSARCEDSEVGLAAVQVLDPGARAFHVALHAAHHGLLGPERFNHGVRTGEDLRRAIATLPLETWQQAFAVATELDAVPAFAYGLRLTPDGNALAERLELPRNAPSVWSVPGSYLSTRGVRRLHRILDVGWGERFRLVTRSVVPSRTRARLRAETQLGRQSTAGAYLEYWTRLARDVVPAVREALALRRQRRAEQ